MYRPSRSVQLLIKEKLYFKKLHTYFKTCNTVICGPYTLRMRMRNEKRNCVVTVSAWDSTARRVACHFYEFLIVKNRDGCKSRFRNKFRD